MATRIFNVRLTDEEYAVLGRVAEERGLSMSGLVKDWIAHSPTLVTMDEMAGAGKAHAACDAEIARLKAELAGRQVSTARVDTSTAGPVEIVDLGPAPSPEQVQVIVDNLNKVPLRPAFLAAKVDDCLACAHEWHSNEGGGCKAAKGTRDRCGCKAYLNEGEPF